MLNNREAGNEIKITCKLEVEEGSGRLLFVSASKEPEELLVNTGECIETLELPAGGNYIYFEGKDLTGKLELKSE